MAVLSQQDVERIHEATLDILEDTGVWFHDSPDAMEIFRKNGCRVDGFRVRLPRPVVEEGLARLPDRNGLTYCIGDQGFAHAIGMKQGESHVGLVGNAYYIHDYGQGRHRDCVETDLDEKFLVMDSLHSFDFDCCLLIFHAERHGGRTFARYGNADACMAFIRSRVRGRKRVHAGRPTPLPVRWWNRSEEERRLEVLALMALQGSEATEAMLEQYNAALVWCNPVSPLQYNPDETRRIIQVARGGSARYIMISPEIMMGATGPVTLAGTLVQHNAEVLAGTILAQLAQAGTPVIYGCVSAVMDLRNTELSQGNVETGLLNAAVVALADRYGMPSRIAPGNTSAREPGVRAAVETALGLYMGLDAGANLITTGLLDSTLMISYEHLVLVDEMIDHLRSAAGGITTDDISLAVEEIRQQGHPSPDYISSDFTVQRMKQDIYYSEFFGRTAPSYEDWYEKAHAKVNDVLRRTSGDDEFDPDTAERLATLEARLREDEGAWRTGEGAWWKPYIRDFT